MRSRGIRLALLATAFLAMGAGREASAFDVWIETVDWVPTTSFVGAPSYATTSYLSPTAYLAPTSFATTYPVDGVVLEPTSYVATSSYVVPTYYETRFRRSLFGRRLIPTGTRAVYATNHLPTTLYYPSAYILPTSYIAPTVIDQGVVATAYSPSGACCGDAVPTPTGAIRPIPSVPAASRDSKPVRNNAEASSPAPRAKVEPNLDDSPALSSEVDEAPPPAAKPRTAPVQSTPKAVSPPPVEAIESSPPEPQPIEKSTAPPIDPAPATKADDAPAPIVPSDDDLLPAPDDLGMNIRREVRKPSTYDVVDRARRNILFGRVRERDSGEMEEGVRVTLSSRSGIYEDRTTMSDAFGRFAVRVPDGDWTVRVAMPSGRVYPVSEITVSNGLITDSEGRDVPSLTITR